MSPETPILRRRMKAFLRSLGRDAYRRRLEPMLQAEIPPSAIVHYGLPAYKKYQFRKDGLFLKRLRKLAAVPRRRRLIQHEDYIRLGTFQEMETWRFLDELWRAGLDYRQVDRYREFSRRLGRGEVIRLPSKRRRITSSAELDAYFEDYVLLLVSMRDHGYLAGKSKDRITILIDRDGSILKETKGRHRLAAAQVVGAPSVPVRISHVHAAWVDAQAGTGGPSLSRMEMTRRAIARTLASVGAVVPRDEGGDSGSGEARSGKP
ncbi:MAG: hypothetical protein LC687_04470 [Actinobacteria bacterium]|nr:hypothetical protein [Actinomycetota bacterium]